LARESERVGRPQSKVVMPDEADEGCAPVEGDQTDHLEPSVREFNSRLAADYERHTAGREIDIVERRRVAELVRAPWKAGGPEMADTADLTVGSLQVPIRIHRPVVDPSMPVLIYAHGGGWMLFSLDTHDRLMREYAARAQVTVVGVDYSLAPEAKFPRPVEELVSVVRWLRSEGASSGLAPSRVAIGGDSAGGNLAVATNLALIGGGEAPLHAQLLNYGAFDPNPRPSHDLFDGPNFNLTSDEMTDFWVNYLPPEAASDPLARPLLADLKGLPPTFLCIAECDILADENWEMADALAEAEVPVTARSYQGAAHSFLEAVSISPLADRALTEASEWLSEALRK
jgi:acetyl esterase